MTYFQLLGPFLLAAFSASFFLVWRRFRHLHSARHFAISYGSLACALTLDWMRDSFDPVIASYLTNIPYLSTAVFFAAGLFELCDRAVLWRSITGLALVTLLILMWFRHVQPDLVWRTVAMTFGVAAIILYAVIRCLPHSGTRLKSAILWAMAFCAVLSLLRTVLALIAEADTLTAQTYTSSMVAWTLQLSTAMSALTVALLLFAQYGGLVMRMLAEESARKLKRVEAQFSKFLSPTVVSRLLAADDIDLMAQERLISILLVDLRGFTTYSDRHGSEAASERVNRFLTIVTDEILHRNGTIDKYLGDAVLAFWNAPLRQDDHADLAIATGRAIEARLRALSDPMEAVAVIESGECNVGNFGTDQRFDYTAIGSAMNLVARLEKEAKARSVRVLVGPRAAQLTSYDLKQIADVTVAGLEERVQVFAPAAAAF